FARRRIASMLNDRLKRRIAEALTHASARDALARVLRGVEDPSQPAAGPTDQQPVAGPTIPRPAAGPVPRPAAGAAVPQPAAIVPQPAADPTVPQLASISGLADPAPPFAEPLEDTEV